MVYRNPNTSLILENLSFIDIIQLHLLQENALLKNQQKENLESMTS